MRTEQTVNAVDCLNCGHRAELDEFEYTGDSDEIPDCENCGEFPVPVYVEPCPNGITRADWTPGKGFLDPDRKCDSDVHEPKSGDHVTEIQM